LSDCRHRELGEDRQQGCERTIDPVDVLEKELSRLLEWIRAAESRLALVLPLSTTMLAALSAMASVASRPVHLLALAAVTALFLATSILFSTFAIFPRTAGPKGSLIFFRGIVEQDLTRYQEQMRGLNRERYFDDLSRQCYRNAEIAARRHTWMRRSMVCMLLGAALWVVFVFLFFSGGVP